MDSESSNSEVTPKSDFYANASRFNNFRVLTPERELAASMLNPTNFS